MRMDLIQPFIGSLDAVLAEMMKMPAKIVDLTMEEEGYRRRGTAAAVSFKGQIEGRVILDMEPRCRGAGGEFSGGHRSRSFGDDCDRDGLRIGEHGDWKCGDAAERCGISFQGFAAGGFDAGTVREGGAGFRSNDTLF